MEEGGKRKEEGGRSKSEHSDEQQGLKPLLFVWRPPEVDDGQLAARTMPPKRKACGGAAGGLPNDVCVLCSCAWMGFLGAF